MAASARGRGLRAQGAALRPALRPALTPDVEVGWGGVACAIAVGGDTLVLPLVGLLAHLDLQGTWTQRRQRRWGVGGKWEESHTGAKYTEVEGIKQLGAQTHR